MRDPDAHAVSRYLSRYAESPESPEIEGCFARSLVVPAFDEDPQCIAVIADQCARNDTLLILVVNAPDSAAQHELSRTRRLLSTPFENAVVIDRVTRPLPRRQGVGLARKIGTDLATRLIDSGHIQSPWIYQTDADARLPDNYFQPLDVPADTGVLIFGYHHVTPDPELRVAIGLYERHMRRYVEGLERAGSPYAYPTLGSTLALHHVAYAKVRGYPKRNAAEDFHLLNKLAKISGVVQQPQIDIELQARLSTRVPFGTGPSLLKIKALLAQEAPFTSYNPQVFDALATVLQALRDFARNPAELTLEDLHRNALLELGWARVEDAFSQRYTQPATRLAAVFDWFDALKTLRFVNAMSRRFPHVPLQLKMQD